MVLDYGKFDHVGDDDDEFVADQKKAAEYAMPQNGSATHYARGLLGSSLLNNVMKELHEVNDREERIKVSDAESEGLLTFIAIQQREDGSADNVPCSVEVINFMQTGRAPKTSLLLAFVWAIDKRIVASAQPGAETQPLMDMLLGALNTILAISKKGSAKALFDELKREPSGAFATMYFAREFGKLRYAKYRAKVKHEEERWHYGDAPPWRDYTPQPVQDALDFVCGSISHVCYETYPKTSLAVVAFGCLAYPHIVRALGLEDVRSQMQIPKVDATPADLIRHVITGQPVTSQTVSHEGV